MPIGVVARLDQGGQFIVSEVKHSVDPHESRVPDGPQNAVGEAFANNLAEGLPETGEVALDPVVEPEGLFLRVAKDVIRGHVDVGPFQGPLA